MNLIPKKITLEVLRLGRSIGSFTLSSESSARVRALTCGNHRDRAEDVIDCLVCAPLLDIEYNMVDVWRWSHELHVTISSPGWRAAWRFRHV